LYRVIAVLTGLLALVTLASSHALSEEKTGMMEVSYVGHRSYPSFTRLVFDTGGAGADTFKVNYDDDGKRVVFYPMEGTLAFTFAPVESVDSLVREVDFVQSDDSKRGISALLGPDAVGCKVSRLSDPPRLAIDVYRKTAASHSMPAGRAVRTIALDPGHGGRSEGSGRPGVLVEKDLTLDLAVRLRNILTRQGFKVILTRDRDADATPDERAGMANNAHADLYISIHASGSFSPDAAGLDVCTMDAGPLEVGPSPYSWPDQSAASLPDSLGLARDLSASLGRFSDGRTAIHQARLAGMEGLTMPGALVEIGNLSDPKQAEALAGDASRDKLASLLADGINRYAKEVGR
jgi:N-acetylmuramoyl-L-alanine amidase